MRTSLDAFARWLFWQLGRHDKVGDLARRQAYEWHDKGGPVAAEHLMNWWSRALGGDPADKEWAAAWVEWSRFCDYWESRGADGPDWLLEQDEPV